MAPSVKGAASCFKNDHVIRNPQASTGNEIQAAIRLADAAVAHHQDADAGHLNEDAMDHDPPPDLLPANRLVLHHLKTELWL
jgi:hypothetical protein